MGKYSSMHNINIKGEASRPGPADCSVELFNRVRKIVKYDDEFPG